MSARLRFDAVQHQPASTGTPAFAKTAIKPNPKRG
jgi:hypothetical protein